MSRESRAEMIAAPVRRLLVVVVILAALAVSVAAVGAGHASAREADRDCNEFSNQAAAQAFFVEHGGSASDNFDDLDADHDGVACESDPCPCSTGSPAPVPAPTPAPVIPAPVPAPEPVPAPAPETGVPAGDRLPVIVVRDVDGDTVYVRYADGTEGYVRLIGIDTPEDVKPGTPVECGARAAASSMRTMAEGRRAELVTDPTQDRFDRYGRLLAYLYVGGRNLDKVQLRDGWAYTYVYEENRFQLYGGFRRAQEAAETERAGVWGKCHGDFHSSEPGEQD